MSRLLVSHLVSAFVAAAATAALLLAAAAPHAARAQVVAPSGLANVEGNNATSITFDDQLYSSLLYIPTTGGGNVAGLSVGDTISGISFRLDNSATGTFAASSTTDFSIFLGQGDAASTAVFANNYVAGTRTQVRSGSLALAAGSFGTGNSGTTPETFGPNIAFSSGYVYQGGALVLEVRRNGFTNPFNQDADSSAASTGLAVVFASGSRTATSGTRVNNYSLPVRLNVQAAVAAAPEPATLPLLGMGLVSGAGRLGVVRRCRRREAGKANSAG